MEAAPGTIGAEHHIESRTIPRAPQPLYHAVERGARQRG
jgi:hypothetical protein